MTREEEIKLNARWRADQYDHPDKWSDTYYGFISGAEWADAHPHWISVEDELPKDGEKVLGYNPNFNAPLVCDCYAGKFGEGWSYFDSGFITHWMPMPQLPKKGGEE